MTVRQYMLNNSNKINNLTTVSVIGHTNTGKTSLLRTLLRDDRFGEVKDAHSTTRHVAQVQILGRDARPLLYLHDTPGLEDATGVMDFLHTQTDARQDGVERLTQFLQAVETNAPTLDDDFSQEAKVIRSLLAADVAIYVIDAREPILSKYKDELAILASSGTPILPVFNFIKQSDEQNREQWREMLARRALHISSAFDTVAFDFDAEMNLWGNLSLLANDTNLTTLQQDRQAIWEELGESGNLLIADFLVNVASLQQKIHENDDPKPTLVRMQNAVRQAEGILQDKLLNLYQFYHTTIEKQTLTVSGVEQDIFDTELLTRYGIRTAGGGTAGLIIGAGIDIATFGASLGLGTVMGGVLGGVLPNSNVIKDKIMGNKTLTIDDATLTLLAARALELHHYLRHRGHASLEQIHTKATYLPWQTDKLPSPLKKARANPHYSSLFAGFDDKANLRADLANHLAEDLAAILMDFNKQ